MSDDIKEYENLYHKIFFTIVRAKFPRICKEILLQIIGGLSDVDESFDLDETTRNFINSIKRKYQGIFESTKTEIMFGIYEIYREGWYSTNGINKTFSDFGTKLILDELIEYQNIKKITDEELVSFINKLHARIRKGSIPTKTEEDMEAEAAERELAAKEEKEEAEEYEKLRWQKEYDRVRSAYPGVSKDNNLLKTRITTAMNERDVPRKAAAQDAYFEKISRHAISREKAAMEARIKTRLTTRKSNGGGLRRRRKRKATRKLRKHYKSRKSSNKHIRRKK